LPGLLDGLRARAAAMRTLIIITTLCLLNVTVVAQQHQKRTFLSPKSNITTAEVAEGFSRYCPNVVLTPNEARADHVLEAAETISANQGTTYKRWHFTLMNRDGDILLTTPPEMHFGKKAKHHFKSVCKFVNK
jgi:hypothetical protein